jgi:mannose-1-phosphate guanylyltransferase
VGIKPKYPHTGMGHILARKTQADGVLVGEKYVEKPDLRLAKVYTESGIYYWNSNLCAWKAKVLLSLMKKHAPTIYTWLPRLKKAIGTSKEEGMLSHTYQMSPTLALEYAISEKLKKFACIPGKFNWTDVGDWSEVKDNLQEDGLGNVIMGSNGKGEYIGVNSKNNLLILDHQLIATVGVSDLLVVDTQDSILICNVKDDQAVKKVVEVLKEMKLTKYL